MIQSGQASFTVFSTETTPERISEMLGLVPTKTTTRGAVNGAGRVRDYNTWTIDVRELHNTESDQTGTVALTELMTQVQPSASEIQRLPADCEARITWSAYSDSSQGGFVLPSELSRAIADLDVDVLATVYMSSDDDD
ncbi:hypothetical protein FHX49_002150 [Microbacterium endophyticum]|uniref:DUF4279 domain-containing protein n=1 Tax=Microbacterium endophyticum TaxID=1526412 RepID=A0A7W4V1P2_9MICO|nr:DUF4279 domain-containing protein [Microbacterium endophyticum]MBB2975242.1 hypothetical protein [Microbacterium endophyticum]MBB2976571.1 hypothetical protein [Microbacterium endophyticum]NIK37546.1 hypothetical protein [Microbacterium endophyticum]